MLSEIRNHKFLSRLVKDLFIHIALLVSTIKTQLVLDERGTIHSNIRVCPIRNTHDNYLVTCAKYAAASGQYELILRFTFIMVP